MAMSGKAALDVSFAGCGFLAMYHVGVLACFSKYRRHVRIMRALGASSGSVMALAALIDYPAPLLAEKLKNIVRKAGKLNFGAFSREFDVEMILKVYTLHVF